MRFQAAIAIAALTCTTAAAQDKATDHCNPIAAQITARSPFSAPQLFIHMQNGWQEIVYKWFGTDFIVDGYSGGRLRFIYVVPPSDVRARQFLSIRSVAASNDPDDFVNLRRHHDQFDTVYGGTYEDYHQNGKTSAKLRRYHRWPNGERSDTPEESRRSWAFQTRQDIARRRVLAISYRASNQPVCVPFVLGPNIATPSGETEGEDEITILKGFVVEITEAKTASGSSGRTFKIRSLVSKVP